MVVAAGIVLLGVVAVIVLDARAGRRADDAAIAEIVARDARPVLGTDHPAPADAQAVTVLDVVAGDTLRVSGQGPVVAGEDVTVRLLLVDAPSVGAAAGDGSEAQCGGEEARDFTAGLAAPGATLLVSPDAEPLGEDGTPLVYAWNGAGVLLNEALARNGLAETVVFPPNDARLSAILVAEDLARVERRGIWGDC